MSGGVYDAASGDVYLYDNEKSMKKPIPEFKNEDEEREFWATHDSSEYVDWSKARRAAFPNLKPSTRAISLRLPEAMLDELRQFANQRDVPYQSLIKIFLRERIDMEYGKHLSRDNELHRRNRMEQVESLQQHQKAMFDKYGQLPASATDIEQMRQERSDEQSGVP